jgi:hypothetical protein
VLKQINCLEAREVIYDSHPKVISLLAGDLHRAMNIAVEEFERL